MQIEIETHGKSHHLTVIHNGRPIYGYCSQSIERIMNKYRQLLHKLQIINKLNNN